MAATILLFAVKEGNSIDDTPQVEFEGLYCSMRISRPAEGVVVVTISGSDIGEFREAPFGELAKHVRDGRKVELFIDARDTKGATVDVSQGWALWLGKNRLSLHQVTMLVGSRFVDVTANFVRSFARLEGIMRLISDKVAFDDALADAVRARRAARTSVG